MAIDTSTKLVSSLWKSLPLPSSEETLDEMFMHVTGHYTGIPSSPPIPIAHGMYGLLGALRSGLGTAARLQQGHGTAADLHYGHGATARLER